MKVSLWKWVAGLIGVTLILSACSGNAPATSAVPGGTSGVNESRATQSFSFSGDVIVTIDTYNGDIKVKAGANDQVQVEVIKHGGGTSDTQTKADLNNIQLSLTQTSGNVKLIATHPGQVPANSAVSFIVTMPTSSTVVASADNGSIAVDGVGGDITAVMGNGSVTVSNAGQGDLSAKTTNGNVTLSGTNVASLKASTSNGDVSFAGSIAAGKAANRIDVGNGNADVTLPASGQFGIDALTSTGQVTSDFVFEGNTSPTAIKGTLGAAPTFNLTVRVKNGAITLKKS